MAVSTEEAPGLILAHGSVGEFLDVDTQVFISRDAGLTWKTVCSHYVVFQASLVLKHDIYHI